MSTKVFDACSAELEAFSSLEYLVSPLQKVRPGTQGLPFEDAKTRVRSDFNNSLQKLTNLVYLLARESTDEQDKKTALVLVQSEVAHLAVLARQAGLTAVSTKEAEPEVTQ